MKYLLIFAVPFLLLSCTRKAGETGTDTGIPALEFRTSGGSEAMAMPEATAFKMSGDYADRVAVTLNSDGSLAYYPAPTDITANSTPVELGDGWWLNRQGLSANSVFTKWTFDEYSAMDRVPTRAEIISAIIPGAQVTDFMTLPVSSSEAYRNPTLCKKLLQEKLKK